MRSLQIAILINNKIRNFPLFPRNLKILKLTNNLITKIPPKNLNNLENLEVLHIDRNLF